MRGPWQVFVERLHAVILGILAAVVLISFFSAPASAQESTESIDLRWTQPVQPEGIRVEGWIVHYGGSPETLDREQVLDRDNVVFEGEVPLLGFVWHTTLDLPPEEFMVCAALTLVDQSDVESIFSNVRCYAFERPGILEPFLLEITETPVEG